MENPISIANFFIKKALGSDNLDELVTNMKVVKLVYIAHGWYLGLTGKPLLSELPQAWKYGPVVSSVYERFKGFKDKPITELAWGLTSKGEVSDFPLTDPSLARFLERIWDIYKPYSGTDLSALTHQPGTPWYQTWQGGGKDELGVPILNPLIEKHYRQLADAPAQPDGVPH